MGVQADIGPAVGLSARQVQILADKVFYLAQIARDAAEYGRAHDVTRALTCLKKINAETAGVAASAPEQEA